MSNQEEPKPSASQAESTYTTRKRKPINHIEIANKKSDDDFITEYMNPRPDWIKWTHPTDEAVYSLSLLRAGNLSPEELDECFYLVEETSGPDYRAAAVGWHPATKRKEMRSPDLRYILVKDHHGKLQGFTSMMPTFENHEPVVYCYEIHLKPQMQGTGLGKQLMGYITTAADNIPSVEKTMLTCFVSNTRGLEFYNKMGFSRDDYSPGERKLRGGKVVAPDYMILSRKTTRVKRESKADPV